MKAKTFIKRLVSVCMSSVIISAACISAGYYDPTDSYTVNAASAVNVVENPEVLPYAAYNLDDSYFLPTQPRISLRSVSHMCVTENGYMRVSGINGYICIEYYDNDFVIQSRKKIEMELPMWGGFYKGVDAYYIVLGQSNYAEDDDAEFMRVIKYDFDWNRLSSSSVSTNSGSIKNKFSKVSCPFEYGCVNLAETDDMLYVVTGHTGYYDSAIQNCHQGFLMVGIDKSTMAGQIVDCDLYHSFSQYIKNNGTDLYVMELSEGYRATRLTKYSTQNKFELKKGISVLEYGGERDSAYARPTYATAEDLQLSADNALCLGISIDQSQYDNYDLRETPFNIYLTVTPFDDFTVPETKNNTKPIWITDFKGTNKMFWGVKLTKINDSKFMVSWRDYTSNNIYAEKGDFLSNNTLHYLFIDGDGNTISKEYTASASFSDCHPIVNGDKIVYCASNNNTVDFYSIDANTGELSKTIYYIAGDNVTWKNENKTYTFSGTGSMYSSNVFNYSAPYIDSDVERLIFKGGITGIPEYTFVSLNDLKEVVIEDGVQTIGEYAFGDCNKLERIYIPESVTQIDDLAFTPYKATIYGYKGSAAEEYSTAHKIKFVPIINVDSIMLNKSAVTLETGKSYNLSAVFSPADATDQSLTWKTGNSDIATVENGKIKAVGTGKVTILAKTANGKTASCRVTVVNKLVNNSTVIANTVQVGDDIRLTAAAKGGTGEYQYAYYFKRSANTNWTTLADFSTKKNAVLIPKAAADYDLKVVVKDKCGLKAEKTFTVKAVSSLALKNMSTVGSTSIKKGGSVKLYGKSIGGEKPVKYQFYFKRESNSTWKRLNASDENAASAKLTPSSAVVYDLKVTAIDAKGVKSEKTFKLTVK